MKTVSEADGKRDTQRVKHPSLQVRTDLFYEEQEMSRAHEDESLVMSSRRNCREIRSKGGKTVSASSKSLVVLVSWKIG